MEVHGLDDLSRGSAERVKVLEDVGMVFHRADAVDWTMVHGILHRVKPDVIMHLAALISVGESIRMPGLYMEVNAEGTRNLVRAASGAGVRRFIYASSAAIYGNPIKLPVSEDHPTSPLSPYGLSKLMGEHYVASEFAGEERPVILRIFNVYGPGQNPEYAGVITRFMERLSRGEPPIIFGDGGQTRDFIHVDDVVEAFIRSLDVTLDEALVANIGSGRPVKIIELARMMIRLYGLDLEPVHAPPRQGDIRDSYADISRARRILGWSPRISLEEGLQKLIRGDD
jgi:UDP-glucose 4-epimerase